MAVAATPRHMGATVLLGKGLTPGKLRGLQRISNPNGTLTMLALDQNSSMIEMAQKALKAKGQDREPTYEEIVEAKLDLMRQMAPAASGVLIDAYYGAWPAIASERDPRRQGDARPGREVGQPEEQGRRRRWARSSRAGASRRSSSWGPTPSSCSPRSSRSEPISAEHQFAAHRAGLRRVQAGSTSCCCWSRSPSRSTARRRPTPATSTARPRRSSSRPASSAGTATSTRPSSPARSATSRTTSSATTCTPSTRRASGPGSCCRRGSTTRDYLKQVEMAMECGCSGVLGGRAFWKEYFLQDGDEARTQFAATTGRKRRRRASTPIVREHGTPWFAKYGLTEDDLATDPRRRGLARPLRPARPPGRRLGRPRRPRRRGVLRGHRRRANPSDEGLGPHPRDVS